MKKLCVLMLLIVIYKGLPGQNDSLNTENKAIGKVTYLHIEHGVYEDYKNGEAILLFNPVKSIYFLKNLPKNDISIVKGDITQYIIGDPEGLPIYKLHAERKILFKTHSPMSQGLCVIEDTLGAINWNILPDKKQFGLMVCQKAIGFFRGRTYEAWFNMDIPISSGPYKLGGLPGLILEARSVDGEVEFIFQGIDLSPKVEGFIFPPTGKYMNMNFESFKKAEAIYLRRSEKEALAKGIMLTITKTTESIEQD